VLLRLGRLAEAEKELYRELEIVEAGLGNKWNEASAIRGILRIARERDQAAPPLLRRRLNMLEAEYREAMAKDPGAAYMIAGSYQSTDPAAAVKWLPPLSRTATFRDAYGRALFHSMAGDDEEARRALQAVAPGEDWERACKGRLSAMLGMDDP
jgi:hypothetical protein